MLLTRSIYTVEEEISIQNIVNKVYSYEDLINVFNSLPFLHSNDECGRIKDYKKTWCLSHLLLYRFNPHIDKNIFKVKVCGKVERYEVVSTEKKEYYCDDGGENIMLLNDKKLHYINMLRLLSLDLHSWMCGGKLNVLYHKYKSFEEYFLSLEENLYSEFFIGTMIQLHSIVLDLNEREYEHREGSIDDIKVVESVYDDETNVYPFTIILFPTSTSSILYDGKRYNSIVHEKLDISRSRYNFINLAELIYDFIEKHSLPKYTFPNNIESIYENIESLKTTEYST